MDTNSAEEINDFYNWSREYWVECSSDPERGFSGFNNFGCWNSDVHNLFSAQQCLFDLFTGLLEPLSAGMYGLEIGCGMGGNSTELCMKYPVKLAAMDISSHQLSHALLRAEHLGCSDRIQHINASALEIPFAAETFDFSLCIESSFHYHDLEKFIYEQARVLKSGALGVIADITCENTSCIRFRKGNYFYSVGTMQQLLSDNHLELLKLERIGSRVFRPLYQFLSSHNSEKHRKVSKYWKLVLSNYFKLEEKGLMGYDIFLFKKSIRKSCR